METKTTKTTKRPPLVHRCSVCDKEFGPGSGGVAGRKDGKPLCSAHYNRALRGSQRADDPEIGNEKRVAASITYRPDRETLAMLAGFRKSLSADGRERSWSETINAAVQSSRQLQTFAPRARR